MIDDSLALQPLDKETPNAYQAFCDYTEMGANRSIRRLHAQYQQSDNAPSRNYGTIASWSKRYEWQRRIKDWQAENALVSLRNNREAFDAHVSRVLPMVNRLAEHIEQMLDTFQQLRVTRRQLIQHPSDPTRQIESVQTKVNARDLRELVSAFGTMNKDLRTMLGLPTVTEIQGSSSVIKTYVTISPDDWDEQPAQAQLTSGLDESEEIEQGLSN